MKPLISVVTPSLNQRRFIGDNLASVENQSYSNVEHIVVDGGSTDSTIDFLANRSKHNRLRWISERDDGQSDAINKGFSMVRGDIVAWINSDDAFFDVQALATVERVFAAHPEVDIVYGNAVRINASGEIQRIMRPGRWSPSRLQRTCFLVQPAVFFRAEVVRSQKLDLAYHYAMDYEYWVRLARRYTFLYVDRIFSVDRDHDSRKILANRPAMIAESRRVSPLYGTLHSTRWRSRRNVAKFAVSNVLSIRELARIVFAYKRAFPMTIPSWPALLGRQFSLAPDGALRRVVNPGATESRGEQE